MIQPERQITTALIFAAGFGKRLAPLTDKTPKPLVDVCGKPLIQYHIERLAKDGITELVINTHWLGDKIREFLGDGRSLGVEICWSNEADILDTGGGMKHALPLLGKHAFLVINADIWTDFPFERLLNKQPDCSGAHLVMVPNPDQHNEGDFLLADNGYLALDKPLGAGSEESNPRKYTYSGIGVYSPGFIEGFKTSEKAFPLREPLKAAIASGKVTAELYQGDWQDIGTLERLETLRARLTSK